MKVSDYMLDLNTGDASFSEAYAIEAIGRLKISCEMYDMMNKIYDSPEVLSPVVLEAWEPGRLAGITISKQKELAIKKGSNAVDNGIEGLYDYVFNNMVCVTNKAGLNSLLTYIRNVSSNKSLVVERPVIKISVMKDVVKKYYEYLCLMLSLANKTINLSYDNKNFLEITTQCSKPTSIKTMNATVRDATKKLDEIYTLINNKRNYTKSEYTAAELEDWTKIFTILNEIKKVKPSNTKKVVNDVQNAFGKFAANFDDKANSVANQSLFMNGLSKFTDSKFVIASEKENPIVKVIGDSMATFTESIKNQR